MSIDKQKEFASELLKRMAGVVGEPIEQFLYLENRFKMLTKSRPEEAKRLLEEAQKDVQTRWRMYEYLAVRRPESTNGSNRKKVEND